MPEHEAAPCENRRRWINWSSPTCRRRCALPPGWPATPPAARSRPFFGDEAEFRTWLFRIIINVFRDRLRAAGPTLLSLDDHPVPTADTTSDGPATAIRAELEELIASEFSRLPPRQLEVLTLVVYEGLSVREVGEIVGISDANV